MGTSMYGRYDELVIELRGWDRVRSGRSEVRVKVDDVVQVRAASPADLVALSGERLLRAGRKHFERVLVLDLTGRAEFDRIVLGVADADRVAGELSRWGVGRSFAAVG